jgi:hypothetical protein
MVAKRTSRQSLVNSYIFRTASGKSTKRVEAKLKKSNVRRKTRR